MLLQDSIGETVSKELSEDEDLFVHLFSYITVDQTFHSACSLMEDILQNRPTLVLSSIRKYIYNNPCIVPLLHLVVYRSIYTVVPVLSHSCT